MQPLAAWAQAPMPVPMLGYSPYAFPGAVAPGMAMQANPLAALNLNDEQRKRLIAIAKETQAANVKIMNEIAKEFEAVQKLSVAIKPECS